MALALADMAWVALGAIILAILIAIVKGGSESEDEKLDRYIKESITELFGQRMQVVTTSKTKKVLWEDKNGTFRQLGTSSNYGDIGYGEFMVFFKKNPKKMMIFPNVFAIDMCVRTIADAVTIVGDKIIIKALGFQPMGNYWFTVTEKMSADDIGKIITRDRDLLLYPSLQREVIKIAEMKVDGSILNKMSTEDISDMESRYPKAKEEKAVELS